jgi:multidrug resistance protein
MQRKPLLTLFVTIFIDLLGFGIIIPILPVFAKKLAVDSGIPISPDVAVGWVAASFSLMQFVFAPLWGSVSDRIGRRPIILGSILATALGYLLLLFSDTLLLLLLARIVAGIGSANIAAAQAYIADITPPHERAKRMGLIGAAFGLGFVFGPPLGGALYHKGGMDAIAWFTAALCIINFIMAWFALPESLKTGSGKKAVFRNPLKGILHSFGTHITGELFAIFFLFVIAFSMMQTNASLLWTEKYGISEKANGGLFGYIGICSALVQGLLIGWFSKRIGEKKMLVWGILLMAVGLTGIPFPPQGLFYPLTAVFLLGIVVANGLMNPAINALVSVHTPAESQGSVLGALQSTGALARGIGPVLAGYLYSVDYHIPYVSSGLLMLLSFVLALRLLRGKLSDYVSLNHRDQGTGS